MQLMENIDYTAFLKQIENCRGDVIFETTEGDHLNLKSTLSQFIFAAFLSGDLNTLNGTVHCSNDADLMLLANFLIRE